MKKLLRTLCLALLVLLLTGCTSWNCRINKTPVAKYTIVYDPAAPDYNQRAAEYIAAEILARTGIEVPVLPAGDTVYDHEIVVGQTNRPISQLLDADTVGMEFALLSEGDHIALEGDYFLIAAAAYYFVDTYIPGEKFQSEIPSGITVRTPETQPTRNVVFLIGDGMGFGQTELFSTMTPSEEVLYYDGEDIFYGYYLPYQGKLRTDSLSGVTDSAAGATALACGYKTVDGRVGRDENGEDVQSLTELAARLGMATAVMSTDSLVGATPAGFSAHADNRDDSSVISKYQQKLLQHQGTILDCGLNGTRSYQQHITDNLQKLEEDETGFFIMYEEGHIDKHSHNWELQETFDCMVRFNQAIGVFMEHALYHPDTLVLITADHETGGLLQGEDGKYGYTYGEHTDADVPIFAWGQGAEAFDNFYEENNYVPKVIAALWGIDDFGQ